MKQTSKEMTEAMTEAMTEVLGEVVAKGQPNQASVPQILGKKNTP